MAFGRKNYNKKLCLYCKNGEFKKIKRLSSSVKFDYNGNEPLKLACKHGHFDIVKHLMCERKCCDTKTDYNLLFCYACESGDLRIVLYLLKIYSDYINFEYENQLALRHVFMNSHFDIINYLREYFQIYKIKPDYYALIKSACISDNFEMVQYLFDNFLDFDKKYRGDDTFYCACKSGNEDISKYFVEKFPKIDHKRCRDVTNDRFAADFLQKI